MSKLARDAVSPPDYDGEASKGYVLTIATVARMFGVSTLTLRLYELRGLIHRKNDGDGKVYSWSDCERIALIVKARRAGLDISAINRIVVAIDPQPAEPVAEKGREACAALIGRLETRQRAVSQVLSELYRLDWELSDRLDLEPAHESSKKLIAFGRA